MLEYGPTQEEIHGTTNIRIDRGCRYGCAFLPGGAFTLGKLFQRVDTLSTDLTQLTAEVRRTNEIVIALANHQHDVDGNTVFTLPTSND